MKDNKSRDVLHSAWDRKYRLVLEGILVGICAGVVAILYRIALNYGEKWVHFMQNMIQGNGLYIIGWLLICFILGLIVVKMVQKEPLISGSGIPQVEGELLFYLKQKWERVLSCKFIAGICCGFSGLSLGREGPSIQLGAMVAKGVSRGFKRLKSEEHLLMTCGAAAGLSAAFNAPLAGVLFALEELHKNFSTRVLVSVMCASVAGDTISRYVFGFQSAFQFEIGANFPLSNYIYLIILGILCGVLGVIYNRLTLWSQDLYGHLSWMKEYKILIPFLLSGILIVVLPDVLGGGHAIIEILEEGNASIQMLFILLIIKWAYSTICFGSGAPGGIFFPLLVLGCLIGACFGNVLVIGNMLDEMYVAHLMIFAMVGFFSSIVRAPITGILLIAEMSGNLTLLLPLALVSIISYIVANALKCDPIYESLLERILIKNDIMIPKHHGGKHLIDMVIEANSYVCTKQIKDIKWPNDLLIVSIQRGNHQIIAKGDTSLMVGDLITVLINEEDSCYVNHQLEHLCKEKWE